MRRKKSRRRSLTRGSKAGSDFRLRLRLRLAEGESEDERMTDSRGKRTWLLIYVAVEARHARILRARRLTVGVKIKK